MSELTVQLSRPIPVVLDAEDAADVYERGWQYVRVHVSIEDSTARAAGWLADDETRLVHLTRREQEGVTDLAQRRWEDEHSAYGCCCDEPEFEVFHARGGF